MNGAAFLVYIGEVLAPTLRKGDTVICDNLSSHKVAGVRELIEDAGAQLLYLPPYSPDMNPIEMAFSKLKAKLRSQCPRSFDTLLQALTEAVTEFPPEHCIGFFRHAKYADRLKQKYSNISPLALRMQSKGYVQELESVGSLSSS